MLLRSASWPARRAVALLAAAAFLSGCHSWRAAGNPAADHLRDEGPRDVRVWRSSSDAPWELEDATVRGDSLVGSDGDGRLRSVPLSDVRRVDVRRLDAGKTTLLVAAGAVVGFGILYSVALTEGIEDAADSAFE